MYVRAETKGDWDAIYFGGQKAWFSNPGRSLTPQSGHDDGHAQERSIDGTGSWRGVPARRGRAMPPTNCRQ